jgi:hypothetical protein
VPRAPEHLRSDESHLSIATLPVLNGKVYVLNSPALYQAAMRSPDISFDPFLVEFTQPTFGLSDRLVEIISRPDVLESMLSVIKETMMGEPMLRTSLAALMPLMSMLNNIDTEEPLVVPDTMSWMKRDFTVATAIALFGEENPLAAEHIHHLW